MGGANKQPLLQSWRNIGLNTLRRFGRGRSSSPRVKEGGLSAAKEAKMRSLIRFEEDEYYARKPLWRNNTEDTTPNSPPRIEHRPRPRLNPMQVTHPWGFIDLHLYLNLIEGKQSPDQRRGGMFLLDGEHSRRFDYQEITDKRFLETVGPNPKVIFECLPILEPGKTFSGAHYALGVNLTSERIFVRRFPRIPDHMKHLGDHWSEGVSVYKFSVAELYGMMERSFDEDKVTLPDLRSHRLSLAPDTHDDRGMEIIIMLRCCQFVVDLAEMLFPEEHSLEPLGMEMTRILADWRYTLEQTSSRAWIAERTGLSGEEFVAQSRAHKADEAHWLFSSGLQGGGGRDVPADSHGYEGQVEPSTELGSPLRGIRLGVPAVGTPFPVMVQSLVDLAQDNPEIDTEENRRRLRGLLMDLQRSLDRQ
ncbi:hypothetical protein FQN54_002162 [Arachnomyces sp. PD_36]|nr:hypothetical protein FQN54_002162 [Arachnomyces sp. PD_36]